MTDTTPTTGELWALQDLQMAVEALLSEKGILSFSGTALAADFISGNDRASTFTAAYASF